MLVSRFDRNTALASLRRFRLKGVRLVMLFSVFSAPAFMAGADEVKPLRLCADPSNLPFSSDDPGKPGLYLEIGQALGAKLGRPVSYNWHKSYFGKRTVRETLLSKQCDAMIGLPLVDDFMGPAVIFSKPIAREGYALISSSDRRLSDIGDLKELRVAVQYQSTPQNLLALRDDIKKVTVLSPEQGMQLLDQGDVDVAFIWAPVAGWLNKTVYAGKYRVLTTEGDGLLWPTAIGFAKSSAALRDEVDAVLPSLQGQIEQLFAKYGVPNDAPIKFGQAAQVHLAAATLSVAVATTIGQASSGKLAAEPMVVAEAKDEKSPIEAGQEIFNGTCAHCHGPNAVQSERRIDLRLLKKRYGDDMQATFWKTVHEGRPSKGMPAWKDVFSDDQLKDVYVYLQTVQDSGS